MDFSLTRSGCILAAVLVLFAPGCAFLDDSGQAIYDKAEASMVADGIENPVTESAEVWSPYLQAAAAELWAEKSAGLATTNWWKKGLEVLLAYGGVKTVLSTGTGRGLSNWANVFNPKTGWRGVATSLAANFVGTHTPAEAKALPSTGDGENIAMVEGIPAETVASG